MFACAAGHMLSGRVWAALPSGRSCGQQHTNQQRLLVLLQVREKEADIDALITPIEEMYSLLLRYEVWPSCWPATVHTRGRASGLQWLCHAAALVAAGA